MYDLDSSVLESWEKNRPQPDQYDVDFKGKRSRNPRHSIIAQIWGEVKNYTFGLLKVSCQLASNMANVTEI